MKERLESKTKEQLIEMLIKANRRRKEETSLWRRKAKVLGWKLEAERKANAKQKMINMRIAISDSRAYMEDLRRKQNLE